MNEEIYGVVELASFQEYKDYQIQFVEKLGESIASTIAGVRTNQKTRDLLEDSQMLAEQMKAQEEEMRQNMEELSATQEEMARKEVEMTGQLFAINNAFAMAEFGMDGTIQHFNENFSKAIGYGLEELKGKKHQVLVSAEEGQSGLWESLSQGSPVTDDFKRRTKSGQEVWLHATYCPIKNKQGEYYKVLQFAEDITALKRGAGQTQAQAPTEGYLAGMEEELRQSLESLEATREVLDAKNGEVLHLQDKLQAWVNLLQQATATFETGPDGLLTGANSHFIELAGAPEASLLGKPFQEVLQLDAAKEEKVLGEIQQAFEAQEAYSAGLSLALGGQGARPFQLALLPMKGQEGKTSKIFFALSTQIPEGI